MNSNKLNDNGTRFYSVCHCIVFEKVYAILKKLMGLFWGPSSAHQIVGRLLSLLTMLTEYKSRKIGV